MMLTLLITCLASLVASGFSQSDLSNSSNYCIGMVTTAQRSLNLTLELQSTNQQGSSIEIDVNSLPNNCFYRQTPAEACKDFPTNSSDLVQVTVWTMKMIQKCQVPAPTTPSFNSNLFISGASGLYPVSRDAAAGASLEIGLGSPNAAGLAVAPGAGVGLASGGAAATVNGAARPAASIAASMGGYNPSGAPLATVMMPVVAGTPQNPFNTALGIVGQTLGPQGITITPATIASVLSLINQVVNLAMSVAPIGGAAAGPIGTILTGMLG